VTLVNLDTQTNALRYLDDSLFFEHHCGRKLNQHASTRNTTRPLKEICHSESHAWSRLDLIPSLSSSIAITEASLYSLQTCIAELFNNIKDHTKYDIGSIFVQHFPKNNEITIAISDFGLAGASLHYLLNTVVNEFHGRVTIYSLKGIVTFLSQGNRMQA
jgi:hypothetical protein